MLMGVYLGNTHGWHDGIALDTDRQTEKYAGPVESETSQQVPISHHVV